MKITVAFIILNYNSYHDTIRVTNEILLFSQKDYHVIIVDNQSPNDSFRILSDEFYENRQVSVIQAPTNGGYAKGNNVGLWYAQKFAPKYVCIINNDVHFTNTTVRNLCKKYKELPNPAVLSPVQKLPSGEVARVAKLDIPSFLYDIRTYTLFAQPPIHTYKENTGIPNVQKVGIVPGAFLFIKYNLFERLGFFDEDTFLYCEERFLGRKVAKNKLNNYILLDECYVHEHSKTISKESSQAMQNLYLFEGKKAFWKNYSRIPFITIGILSAMRKFNEFEISAIKIIKKMLS